MRPTTIANEDIDRVYRLAVDKWWDHSEWRRGQALMNALWELHPDVCNEINATDADCFFDDAVIPAFWEELGRRVGSDLDGGTPDER